MARAKQGDTVQVHYTLYSSADGSIIDETAPRMKPLELTIGAGHVIPGFEEALIGMQPGETKFTHLPAEKAFGPYRDELVVTADRTRFSGAEPQVGQTVQVQIATGDMVPATVTAVAELHVTVDANHPQAGSAVHCELHLVAIVGAPQ